MTWFATKHLLWDLLSFAISVVYFFLIRLPCRLLTRPRTLPILAYHGVAREEVRQFQRQLVLLKRQWRFLTLDEIVPCLLGASVPRAAAHVTFDDALQNVADHAAPVLRALGVPASIFAVTGADPGPPGLPRRIEPAMTWETICRLDSPRLRFESHTATHAFLAGLPAEGKARELAGSRATLSRRLSREVVAACYPGGRFDDETKRITRECGYRVGFATTTHTDQPADPFEVRRLPLTPTTNLLKVWLLAQGAYNWYAPLSRMRQRWLSRRDRARH